MLISLRVCAHVRACVCVCSHVQFFVIPMDYSPPGSSVHAIFQARILEWFAISPYFTQNSFFVFLFGLCDST